MRACGYFCASAAVAVMRSADSLRSGVLRAADNSGPTAPPSTMIPAGASRVASHGGERSSSGSISALPSGGGPGVDSGTAPGARRPRPARGERGAGAAEGGEQQHDADRRERRRDVGRQREEADDFREDEEHGPQASLRAKRSNLASLAHADVAEIASSAFGLLAMTRNCHFLF